MGKRYLVTVINSDDSVFTYGVKTIGGRQDAINKVKAIKSGHYFIHAKESYEKSDYEIPEDKKLIPEWVNKLK